jgi:uncharacterized Zn-binding protein involved in type VI secretion
MPAVQRNGDKNSAEAPIEGGVISVRVNGQRVSVDGTKVAKHGKHETKTANGSRSVRANNTPINVTGNKDGCAEHSRVGGSKDVFIGGR